MLKLKEINYNGYLISNNKNLLPVDMIYDFLSESYWAKDRPKKTIKKSIKNSDCFGIYIGNQQVGFARIITDYSVIYWLCDVFIDEKHRGIGLGKKLVDFIVNNDELKNLTGILATRDAHMLYEKYGFKLDRESFMGRKRS